MRQWSLLSATMVMILGLLLVASCSRKDSPKGTADVAPTSKPAPPAELNLLMFSDYIDEGIVKDFEKEKGVRVRINTYESTEEMEGKLTYTGADSQYDVVIAASQVMGRLARRKLVQPLNHSKIPNLKNLDPRFTGAAFENNEYGAPYQWGTVGLFYNKSKLPAMEQSWSVIFDTKKIAGKFLLLDEMRDMLGAAMKYKGYSSNSVKAEEVREAARIIQEAKRNANCVGFKSAGAAIQDIKSGAADIAVVWNGDSLKEVLADPGRLAYIVPKEGTIMWVDLMMVLRRAPNPDLGHAFINYILEPKIGGRLSDFLKYASPNAAAKAHLPPQDLANPITYPPDEAMKQMEHHRDLGDAAKLYDDAWTTVKAH